MTPPVNRREFITASAAVAAGLGLVGFSQAQTPAAGGQRGGGAQAPATLARR